MMTKGDRLIFVLVLVFSLVLFLLFSFLLGVQTGSYLLIEVDGEEWGRYLLQEKYDNPLEIRTEFGYNKVVIENGSARVTESDCPDHREIAAGAIKNNGEMLICLPNRLVLRVIGGKGVDGLAY